MGYFEQSLKPLLIQLIQVFNSEECSRIVSRFKEEFNFKTLPNHFMHLIRLNEFVLGEYQALQQVVKEERIHDIRNQQGGAITVSEFANGSQKKEEENSSLSRREHVIRGKHSTLLYVPLEMVSNTLSYRSVSDSMFASKYGNVFLFRAAVKCAQNLNTDILHKLEVSYDNVTNLDTTLIRRYKEFADTINHVHFTECEGDIITKEFRNTIVTTLKHCKNLEKVEFDEWDRYEFLHREVFHDFISSLTTECKNFTHVKFSSEDYEGEKEDNEADIKSFFTLCDKIKKITIKAQNFQNTGYEEYHYYR